MVSAAASSGICCLASSAMAARLRNIRSCNNIAHYSGLVLRSFSDIALLLSDSNRGLHRPDPGLVWRAQQRITNPSSLSPQRPSRMATANREPEVRCGHPSHPLVSSADAIDRPAIAPNLPSCTSSPNLFSAQAARCGGLQARGPSRLVSVQIGIRRKGGSYSCRSLCSGPAHVRIDESPIFVDARPHAGEDSGRGTSRQRPRRRGSSPRRPGKRRPLSRTLRDVALRCVARCHE